MAHHDHSTHLQQNTDNSMNHEGHDMPPMHGHAMAFHFGSSEVVLFDFWNIKSSWGKTLSIKNVIQAKILGILISCFVVILLCFAMETLRWFRVYRKQVFLSNPENQQIRRRK